jgi:glutamate/tyrosine decarboxylase-like PLP-dependent enzyme
MVLPTTAHAAFHKAASYFDVEAILVDVDPVTFRADPAALRAALTPDTILLVASAPSYAHGVVDPVEEIAALARERGLWLHVDACIGGFLLPFLRRLGVDVPAFDLSVEGVSSISMDFHEYAFAAKGASVVLYKSAELRRSQYFACARWTGYTVVNSTMQSTKSGGPLAATWAVLQHLGEHGYLELARRTHAATRALIDGIAAIDGLRVMGSPDMSLVAFTSDTLGVFRLADALQARGWYVQPQLALGASRESIHLTVGPQHEGLVPEFLEALCAAVDDVRRAPPSALPAAVVGALARLDPARFDERAFREVLALAGLDGTSIPAEKAAVNELLNALPPALRERLLGDFLSALFA